MDETTGGVTPLLLEERRNPTLHRQYWMRIPLVYLREFVKGEGREGKEGKEGKERKEGKGGLFGGVHTYSACSLQTNWLIT